MDLDPETREAILEILEGMMITGQAMKTTVASMSSTVDRLLISSNRFSDVCSGNYISESPNEIEANIMEILPGCISKFEISDIKECCDESMPPIDSVMEDKLVFHSGESHIANTDCDEIVIGESSLLEPLVQNAKTSVENSVEDQILEGSHIDKGSQVQKVSSTGMNFMADSVSNQFGKEAAETLEVSSASVLHIQDILGSAELSILVFGGEQLRVFYNVSFDPGINPLSLRAVYHQSIPEEIVYNRQLGQSPFPKKYLSKWEKMSYLGEFSDVAVCISLGESGGFYDNKISGSSFKRMEEYAPNILNYGPAVVCQLQVKPCSTEKKIERVNSEVWSHQAQQDDIRMMIQQAEMYNDEDTGGSCRNTRIASYPRGHTLPRNTLLEIILCAYKDLAAAGQPSDDCRHHISMLTRIQGKGGTHNLTLERLLLCSLRFLCWVSEHSLHVITVTFTPFRGLVLVIDVTVTIRTRYKAARRYKTTSNSIWDGGLVGVIVQRFLYGSDNEVDTHLFPKITTTVVCNCIFRIVQSFFNSPLFTLLIAWRAVISKLNTMFNSSGVRHLLGDDKQLVVLLNAYTLLARSSCTKVQYLLHNFRTFKARTVWFSVTSRITATALSIGGTILELLAQDGTGWFMVSISYLVIETPVTHRSSKNVQCWFCTQSVEKYKLMNIVEVLAMQAQNSRLSQVLFRLDPLSYKDDGTTASDLCMLMLEVSVQENGFVRMLTLCSKESLLISSKLVKDLNIIAPTLHTKRMKNSGIKGVHVLIYHVTVGSPTLAIVGDSGYTTIFTILLGCTIQGKLAESLCYKYGRVNHQYYEYAAILTVVLHSNKGSPGGDYMFSPALVIKIYLIAWTAVYKFVMLMEASIFLGNSSLWKQLVLSRWFTGLLVRQPYGYQLEWWHCQLDLLQLITSSLKFFMWKGRVQVIDTREFPYMIFYFYAEVVANRGTLMGYLSSVIRGALVDAGWRIAWACLIQLQWHYTLNLLQMLLLSSMP